MNQGQGATTRRDAIAAQLQQTEETVVPLLRQLNQDTMAELHRRYTDGEEIGNLVRGRAEFVDDLLTAVWEWCGLPLDSALSLVAVGGYGRGELHPHSDIDLLILIPEQGNEQYQEALEKLVALLWDIKLAIGHSVRTVNECAEVAAEDITVVTNLLESRILIGDGSLLEQLQQATGADKMWDSRAFYRAKWEEQFARHRKYADTEYNLEPNIKTSPGGMRDLQTIAWIGKRHFGTEDLHSLVARNSLTEEEYRILQEGRDFLWLVRWALHMLTDRAEDRLLFEHQREIASMFGFTDSEESLAIEKFMQLYYRWALALSGLNELVIQLYDETILRACDPENLQPINQRFNVRNNYIDVSNDKVFKTYPSAILEMFVLLAENENIIGPRASTIRLIREARHLIDDEFRTDPRHQKLFIQLLRSPHRIATQLQRMTRFGILGTYLPEFGRIIGKMQHDLFHIYTVDAHTIQVVKNMRLFAHAEFADRFPLAASIVKRLPKLDLLYIAGLYHDIAKGRGGDHSEKGAVDAERFCINHGFNSRDTDLVVWLVQNHLVMSSISQRKDISDPDVIRDFARLAGDQERLDYLYALTVADINATNPKLWNNWRASLLRQLFLETRRALRASVDNYADRQDWADESKENAIRQLEDIGYDADEVIAIWNSPDQSYFLHVTPADIAWHTQTIAAHKDKSQPLVAIRDTSSRQHEGATQVFVHTSVFPGLFAVIAGTFERLQLSIQDAGIFNNASGHSMSTYIVLDANGEALGHDTKRIDEIVRTLVEAIANRQAPGNGQEKLVPRQLKHFDYPTDVKISNDKNKTIIEVVTPDRPGVLAHIGRVFINHKLKLKNAKISTLGERVEDVFFVTDADGAPLTDSAIREALRKELCAQLDQKSGDTQAQTQPL